MEQIMHVQPVTEDATLRLTYASIIEQASHINQQISEIQRETKERISRMKGEQLALFDQARDIRIKLQRGEQKSDTQGHVPTLRLRLREAEIAKSVAEESGNVMRVERMSVLIDDLKTRIDRIENPKRRIKRFVARYKVPIRERFVL